jgi:hypothetical protein
VLSKGSAVIGWVAVRSVVIGMGAASPAISSTTTSLGAGFATFSMRIIALIVPSLLTETARFLVESRRPWPILDVTLTAHAIAKMPITVSLETRTMRFLAPARRL